MNNRFRPASSRSRSVDPVFQFQDRDADAKVLSPDLIKSTRITGKLNLSKKGLATVPERVWTLDVLDETEVHQLELRMDPIEDSNCRWWEYEPLSVLDLNSNCLTHISPSVKNLCSLSTLNLQDNHLDSLPDELGELRRLKQLNISNNNFHSLPPVICCLTELQVLCATHNQLEVIHEGIGDLVMLHHLDLSFNCVPSLPIGMGFLVRLTRLNLSHNNLMEIPPDLVNLCVLQDLKLDYNKLSSIPPLGKLHHLEVLSVGHNLLTSVPYLCGCENLQEVHLGCNQIQKMAPECIEGLARLRVLNLHENQLAVLPMEMSSLSHLKQIDLSNNLLESLPPSLCLIPHLHNMKLEGNPLHHISRDILRCGTPRILRFLRQKLKTEAKVVISIPSDMCDVKFPDRYTMRNNDALNLAHKDLCDVPLKVFKDAVVAEVSVLDLSKNKFTKVPEGLEELTEQLSELNFSYNFLKSVPPTLGGCSKLQYLDLKMNALTTLPDELAGLQQLRELNIASNKFQELPPCIFEMIGLEILDARDNQVCSINVDGLKKLRRLAVLNFCNNNISYVPPELGYMTQLSLLELSGNCFRQPRYSILEKGTTEILSYLRDRTPSDGAILNKTN